MLEQDTISVTEAGFIEIFSSFTRQDNFETGNLGQIFSKKIALKSTFETKSKNLKKKKKPKSYINSLNRILVIVFIFNVYLTFIYFFNSSDSTNISVDSFEVYTCLEKDNLS